MKTKQTRNKKGHARENDQERSKARRIQCVNRKPSKKKKGSIETVAIKRRRSTPKSEQKKTRFLVLACQGK